MYHTMLSFWPFKASSPEMTTLANHSARPVSPSSTKQHTAPSRTSLDPTTSYLNGGCRNRRRSSTKIVEMRCSHSWLGLGDASVKGMPHQHLDV